MPCRAPSSPPGASSRPFATRIASRPGSGACSSTPATPRPGVAGRGRRTSGSCRSTGRRPPTRSVSVIDRDALDRAFRRLTVEQRAVFVLHHHAGAATGRDRRNARRPGRDGPLATPLRDQGAARGRRGRRRAGPSRRTDGMTANDDFDRIARAWLDLMPDEAPDRAVHAVLQAVETTPQVRRPWRWLPWRSLRNEPTFLRCSPRGNSRRPIGGAVLLIRSSTDRQSGGCRRRPSRHRLPRRPPTSAGRRFGPGRVAGAAAWAARTTSSRTVRDPRSSSTRRPFELAQSNENNTAKLTARVSSRMPG